MESARPVVPARLRGLVADVHGYRVPPMPGGLHRGLPGRHLTFVLSLAAPLTVDGSGVRLSAYGIVGGLHMHPVRIDASQAQDGVQVALTPAGARRLLGVPAGALAGMIAELPDVAGRRGAELVERLAGEPDWDGRWRVLGEWLQPGDERATPPAELRRAWELLLGSRGRVRVAELAADVGWSRRHLTGRFTEATGLSPKQFGRVLRFEHAAGHLRRPRVDLAGVALVCGYADQAHLSREWRELAGCSPTVWRREELPFLQDGDGGDDASSSV